MVRVGPWCAIWRPGTRPRGRCGDIETLCTNYQRSVERKRQPKEETITRRGGGDVIEKEDRQPQRSVKRRRQPKEETITRRGGGDVIEKEDRQPHISVKRKRQLEAAVDVIKKEDNQPQLSRGSQDNCGSRRRRVQEKKGGSRRSVGVIRRNQGEGEDLGDCVEDTNSMVRSGEGWTTMRG